MTSYKTDIHSIKSRTQVAQRPVEIEERDFIADFLLNMWTNIQNHVPQNGHNLRLRLGEGGNIV